MPPRTGASDHEQRWGLFEAPADPRDLGLEIDPAWSPLRLSGAIIRAVLPFVVVGSLLLVTYNVAGMLVPVAVGRFVDEVIAPLAAGATPEAVSGDLTTWSLALVGLYLAMNLGFRFGGRIGWLGVQQAQYELSQAMIRRILDERGMAGPARAPGGLLSIATADVYRSCLVLYVVVYPPGEVVGLLVAAGILFWVHPGLGLGVLVGLPVLLLLMHRVARPLHRRSMAEQAGLADAAAGAADLVAGYRVIRGLHAQGPAARRYRGVSRSALGATLRARSAEAGFEGVSAGAAQAFAAAVAVVAALLAFAGTISVGQLVTVAGVAVTLVGPLDALVSTLGSRWAVSQASCARVLELTATEHHPAAVGEHAPGEGESPLSLSVPGPHGPLEAVVHPGELVAMDLPQGVQHRIVETLVLRSLDDATITWAGRPVHEHAPDALRSRVHVAPHAPGIFAGTVLDNVRAAGPTPVPAAVAERALEVAGLGPDELPDGYETVLGDGGHELSGGQRQRVALARTIAADPEVLVLVDPTTAIDAVTEQRIADSLRAHRDRRTTIVLTSSSAFHTTADRSIAEPVP